MSLLHRLEPLWWMLFGAGGFAAALVLPALFFVVAFGFPMGWFGDSLTTFQRMQVLFGNPVGQGVLAAVISLTFWHSAHHLRHFAIDLGVSAPMGPWLYGLALAGTLASAWVVFAI